MNISYSWLKRYVDFNLSPDELSAVLTSIGLEVGGVERVESIRGGLRGLVIGRVLTCVEHPDSDHLHITTVDLGDGQPTQIVCGAPNVAAGQTVVVATVGTTLYDGDNEFKIKKSKIRGVESFGMICAEDEIGVGTSHDGIIVIDKEIAPGTPAAEYFGISDDYVLEVDLTPNRIDAASHYGVARDLAAWLDCHAQHADLHRPSVDAFAVDTPEGAVAVEVDNPEACTRYSGLTIRNVKVGPSPEWLQKALNTIGLRPINNIVDITNFLLHAFCQPLHCFDLDKVAGDEIRVRTCPAGTKFTTLDGVERTLDAADLMICNAREPMCIAGVFGGLDSGVTDHTTSIFLESACFNATSVRRTARRHGLNTDASFRFERGVDPSNTLYVLKLAALMVKELAGGEICGEPVDIYPTPVKPAHVELNLPKMTALIGKDLGRERVEAICRSLEMEVAPGADDDTLSLTIPTYRVDVTRPCDVIEDVLRIYGYNNVEISTTLHSSLSYKTLTDSADDLRRLIAEQLTGMGFNEILNNSLTAERYYADLSTWPLAHCVRLLNPLSSDLCVMRQTLLFGGLETLAHNINRRSADLMMYETGNVYFYNPSLQSAEDNALTPFSESARLGIWLTGNLRTGNWLRPAEEATVYDLRAIVDSIFMRLGISRNETTYTVAEADDIFGASLAIATRSGKALGRLGIVAKSILKVFDIKQPVLFAELDWMALVKLALRKKVTASALPKTQPVNRDLALLLDAGVSFEAVEATVRQAERKLLRSVELFDVYEGKNLPEGKKSYAIALTLQDNDRTLQDKDIDRAMTRIIDALRKNLGAELR